MAIVRTTWGAVLAVLLGALMLGAPVQAQDGPAWIQLEALPDKVIAAQRALAYSADIEGVSGFSLGPNWFVITIGPFAPAEAAGKMASLKAAGQIPRDAFISDGSDHGTQYWPTDAIAADGDGDSDGDADAASADPTAAQDQPAGTALDTAAPVPPPADETAKQAAASEGQLPRAEKVKLQEALQWYGYYQGGLDGSIGRGTRASMSEWQTALGYEPTGVLTTLQRATLIANYQADEASFGFTQVTEAEAGIEFSLPANLLKFDHYEPPFVHYTAIDGSKLRLLLISEPGDETTLAGLYDLLQTLEVVPAAGERLLDGAEFSINAASGTVASFSTARSSKGTIKGYLLVWPPEQSETAQRILAVMASSFRSTGDVVLDPGLVPLDATVKAGVLAGMAVKEPKSRVSGAFIDISGLVLTTADGVASCGKITLDGNVEAEVAAIDAALGAAVLRPLSPVAPFAVAATGTQSIAAGAQVLLAGYSLPTGLPAPVLTQGRVEGVGGPSGEAGLLTLAANITPHDLGGPVLNEAGALVGMIFGTQVGGKSLPSGVMLVRDAASLAPLMAKAGMQPAEAIGVPPALTPDALNAAAMGMTVQVTCWP